MEKIMIGDKFKALVKERFSKEGKTFYEGELIEAIWMGTSWIKIPISWNKEVLVSTSKFELKW